AIAETVRGVPPHRPSEPAAFTQLSGLEPLTIRPDSNFILIGERTNVTGSRKFARLVGAGDDEEAFLAQARLVRRYGAAVVVMAFDEEGQATTAERRVAIARRAFALLTEQA